jgi:hypothetical protein
MYAMKTYRDMAVEFHSFLTSEINERIVSFTPKGNVPNTH